MSATSDSSFSYFTMSSIPHTSNPQLSKSSSRTQDSSKLNRIAISKAWKEPLLIEDEDLTFDGKPLNLLYEENRWTAEHAGHDERSRRIEKEVS